MSKVPLECYLKVLNFILEISYTRSKNTNFLIIYIVAFPLFSPIVSETIFSRSKLLFSESLLHSHWSGGPVCFDYSAAYSTYQKQNATVLNINLISPTVTMVSVVSYIFESNIYCRQGPFCETAITSGNSVFFMNYAHLIQFLEGLFIK